MNVFQLVEELNLNSKIVDVAERFGVSKDTLSRRLKELNYSYNQKLKRYEYVGKEEEKNNIDDLIVSDVLQKKRVIKSEKSMKDVIVKEEKIHNKESLETSNIEAQVLSVDEINSLKSLANMYKRDDVRIFIDLAFLPYDGDKVKKSIVIDADLYIEFERFAERFDKKGLSKNQLLELAIHDFIKKYCNQ